MTTTMLASSITLTETQKNAISKAVYWFKNETDTQKIFTVGGYAGTGKTTVVRSLIEELGIKESRVTYIAFTGKAALQLTRNGNRASTIHRLIYDVKDINGQVRFEKKNKDALDYDLLVIDEVSMVPKDILEDLKTFDIPILAIGDHGQLDPIGETNGLLEHPDVQLTEIHRQAKDNPIIYLSMLARQGKPLPRGALGSEAFVLPKNDPRVKAEMFLRADQVLCSYNKTRHQLNMRMRQLLGFPSPSPAVQDKIICTKNNWEENIDGMALINGLIGNIQCVKNSEGSNALNIDFLPEFMEEPFTELDTLVAPFLGKKVSPAQYRYFNMFDYGYAITTHKSQGSQWPKVAVQYQPMGNKDSQKKLLYTAITRAQEKLILVLPA
ncbi:ATP-dependent DNA helicase [Salibacterium aidingense]|uniref:ATP-dependent DNA helicase n=1 Tax=Salibacterium aidingense TaxID=384933 RepID=UPI0004228C90|nr:AAA family ATPase [Salibacterium aidingense]